MEYNFDEIVVRKGSHCCKWDSPKHDDIIPMWIADMDFRVAEPIINALRKRVEHGVFGYVCVEDEYYNSVINWFNRRHNWHIERDWILYTTGVVPAVSVAIKALTEPGDKVLIQTPVYNCFFSSIKNNGCESSENPLIYENGYYRIDFEDFERRAADPKVKVFVLCNPHTPACRVWTKEELQKMSDICLKHDVRVIADEIHCELVMPGQKYVPFATLSDECRKNTVVCNSPSKSFNTAGLHMANIICSEPEIREKISRAINVNEVCDVNVFGPEMVIAAYNESEDWLDQLNVYIKGNYDALVKFFEDRIPQLKVLKSEGTYLAWVDISALGTTGDELSERLLNEGKVYINPGSMYGNETGRQFVRINMACPRKLMLEGLERMAKVLCK